MAKYKHVISPREFGVYINFERVFKQQAREGDIEFFMSQIPLDFALKFLCGTATLVHNFKGSSFYEFQKGFVRELGLEPRYTDRINEHLVHPNILLTSEQLASLQKFAILNCAPERSALPSDANDLLMKALLAYNSLRGKEGLQADDRHEAVLNVELRNMFSAHELTAFLVDMYWEFFKWAASDEGKESENYLDVNNDFKEFYGISYFDYAVSTFVFLARYLPIKTVADFARHNPFFDVDQYLQNLGKKEVVQQWLRLNTMTLAEAKAAFEKPYGVKYSGLSLEPLLTRPLVFAEGRTVFCPHLPYLENKLGTGIFFALLDGYNNADGNRKRSKRFTQFFGDFFEQHCVGIAKETHPTPDLVFSEIKYRPGHKSTDLVIFEGECATFIDITTARLTMKDTLVELNAKSVLKDVDKIVDNAKQMTGAIDAFRRRQLVYKDRHGNVIDPDSIKKIYPVALIIAPIPRFWAFNNLIFNRLKEKGYLPNTQPFEVLSAEDFDILMRLVRAGLRVCDVLERKLTHPVPFVRTISLKNFMAIHDDELRAKANSVPWTRLGEAWYDDVTAVVKTWGLQAE